MKVLQKLGICVVAAVLIVPSPAFGKQIILKCIQQKFNNEIFPALMVQPFFLTFNTTKKTFKLQKEKSSGEPDQVGSAEFSPSYIRFYLYNYPNGTAFDSSSSFLFYSIDRTDLTYRKVQKTGSESFTTEDGACKITPVFRLKKNLI